MKYKPLTSKALLFLSLRFQHPSSSCSSSSSSSSSFSLFLPISHFSTYPSPPSSSPSSSSYSRRHEEERNVRVSVWWDFENCSVPAGVNVFKVGQLITSALRTNGVKGPVNITAFGDVLQLSRATQEALSATGINIIHIPRGGKNSADRSLLVDLMFWVSQNPPPAHLFLISGDRDFASTLHRLRMNNYNILLASPESAPGVLCSAASIIWDWAPLVKGHCLTGKYYNQPPDGPYGSWYGHYRAPLKDPFAGTEQLLTAKQEQAAEANAECIARPVPDSVIKQIRNILSSYPNGIPITSLRAELGKSNVLDKDFFGHKKFTRLLLSLPHVLKLHSEGDGQYMVREAKRRPAESIGSNAGTTTVSDNRELQDVDELTVDRLGIHATEIPPEKSAPSSSQELNVPVNLENIKEHACTSQNMEKPSKVILGKDVGLDASVRKEGPLPPPTRQDSHPEVGFLTRVWTKFFGARDKNLDKKADDSASSTCRDISSGSNDHATEKSYRTSDHTEKKRVKEETQFSTAENADPLHSGKLSPSVEKSVLKDKVTDVSVRDGENSSIARGFFKRVAKWFRFRGGEAESQDPLIDVSSQVQEKVNSHFTRNDVFSDENFWNEMKSFLYLHGGSEIITQSRTREEMAKNLSKARPSILKSIGETDLLHLVDLLISEKKLVEEDRSQTFPFKITRSNSDCSNGLRSIFLSKTSDLKSVQRLSERDGQRKHQSIPHSGVSPSVLNEKSFDRSRSQILADCQKLGEEIVKQFPEGYYVHSFKKHFLEKYGYPLDCSSIGYPKVTNLLQIMPGVRLVNSKILPAHRTSRIPSFEDAGKRNSKPSTSSSNIELLDSAKKDGDGDFLWDELGPLSSTASSREGPEHSVTLKNKKGRQDKNPDYEVALLDEELSDSEDDGSVSGLEVRENHGMVKADNSLQQILESWYSSGDGDNREKVVDDDDSPSPRKNGLKPSNPCPLSSELEDSSTEDGRKQRSNKRYSFVLDNAGEKKNDVSDGLWSILKRTQESRMHS